MIKIPIDPFLSRAIVEGIFFEKILFSDKYAKYLKNIPKEEITMLKKKGLVETITIILSLLINFSNIFLNGAKNEEKGE